MDTCTAIPDLVVEQHVACWIVTPKSFHPGKLLLLVQRLFEPHCRGVCEAFEQGGLLCLAVQLPEPETEKDGGQRDQGQAQFE